MTIAVICLVNQSLIWAHKGESWLWKLLFLLFLYFYQYFESIAREHTTMHVIFLLIYRCSLFGTLGEGHKSKFHFRSCSVHYSFYIKIAGPNIKWLTYLDVSMIYTLCIICQLQSRNLSGFVSNRLAIDFIHSSIRKVCIYLLYCFVLPFDC